MERKIPMAPRRHVTNKLRTVYVQAGKSDKTRILNEVMATTGLAPIECPRNVDRWCLAGLAGAAGSTSFTTGGLRG